MKLSKAQQEVVDKMREGWELCYVPKKNRYYLIKSTGATEFTKGTTYSIFRPLLHEGAIEFDYSEKGRLVYRLTEQYKTKQK